ncbi:hypothetical protein H4219_003703 [Mycoemilia scoparia]|uniref:Uncharacterized protein n=1 Tax=Mycoemilia scoparia TaxID=417184 RepID=A0A9W8DSZ7_9FUNG|nr:hypothetical protein H4219_003703 [Mycoemilia scoparia]
MRRSWIQQVFMGFGVVALIANIIITFSLSAKSESYRSSARLYISLVMFVELVGLAWGALRLCRILGRAKHQLSLTTNALVTGSSPISPTPYPLSSVIQFLGVQALSSLTNTGYLLLFVLLIRIVTFLSVDIDQVSGSTKISGNLASIGVLGSFGSLSTSLIAPLIMLTAFPYRCDNDIGLVRLPGFEDMGISSVSPLHKHQHHLLPETPSAIPSPFVANKSDKNIEGEDCYQKNTDRSPISYDTVPKHLQTRSEKQVYRGIVSASNENDYQNSSSYQTTKGLTLVAPKVSIGQIPSLYTEYQAPDNQGRVNVSLDGLIKSNTELSLISPQEKQAIQRSSLANDSSFFSIVGSPPRRRRTIKPLPDIPELPPASPKLKNIHHARSKSDYAHVMRQRSSGNGGNTNRFSNNRSANTVGVGKLSNDTYDLNLSFWDNDSGSAAPNEPTVSSNINSLYLELPLTIQSSKPSIYEMMTNKQELKRYNSSSNGGQAGGNYRDDVEDTYDFLNRSSLNPFVPLNRKSTNPFSNSNGTDTVAVKHQTRHESPVPVFFEHNDSEPIMVSNITAAASQRKMIKAGNKDTIEEDRRSSTQTTKSWTGREWLRDFYKKGFEVDEFTRISTENAVLASSKRSSAQSKQYYPNIANSVVATRPSTAHSNKRLSLDSNMMLAGLELHDSSPLNSELFNRFGVSTPSIHTNSSRPTSTKSNNRHSIQNIGSARTSEQLMRQEWSNLEFFKDPVNVPMRSGLMITNIASDNGGNTKNGPKIISPLQDKPLPPVPTPEQIMKMTLSIPPFSMSSTSLSQTNNDTRQTPNKKPRHQMDKINSNDDNDKAPVIFDVVKEVSELSKNHENDQKGEKATASLPQTVVGTISVSSGPELIRKNSKAAMRRKGRINRNHNGPTTTEISNNSSISVGDRTLHSLSSSPSSRTGTTMNNSNDRNSAVSSWSNNSQNISSNRTPQIINARVSAFPNTYQQHQLSLPTSAQSNTGSSASHMKSDTSIVDDAPQSQQPGVVIPRPPKRASLKSTDSSSAVASQSRNTQASLSSSIINRDSDVINQNFWELSNRSSRVSDRVRSIAVMHDENYRDLTGYPYSQSSSHSGSGVKDAGPSAIYKRESLSPLYEGQGYTNMTTSPGSTKRISRIYEDMSTRGGSKSKDNGKGKMPAIHTQSSIGNISDEEPKHKMNLLERRVGPGNLQVHAPQPLKVDSQAQQVPSQKLPDSTSVVTATFGNAPHKTRDSFISAHGGYPDNYSISSPVPFSPYLKETLTPMIGDPSKVLSTKRKSRIANRPTSMDESSTGADSVGISPMSSSFGFPGHHYSSSKGSNSSASKGGSYKRKSASRLSQMTMMMSSVAENEHEEVPSLPSQYQTSRPPMYGDSTSSEARGGYTGPYGKNGHIRSLTVSQMDKYEELEDLVDSEAPEKKALADALIGKFPAIDVRGGGGSDVSSNAPQNSGTVSTKASSNFSNTTNTFGNVRNSD